MDILRGISIQSTTYISVEEFLKGYYPPVLQTDPDLQFIINCCDNNFEIIKQNTSARESRGKEKETWRFCSKIKDGAVQFSREQ